MTKTSASVLILDDEADIREILQAVLEDAGYKCTAAADVDEGIAVLSSQEFDLAFSDIRMPGKPVAELLQEIRRAHANTQVIMMTALNTSETAEDCLRMGADDYLAKPFNLSEVLVAADRAMEKKRLVEADRGFRRHLEPPADDKRDEANGLFYSITQILIRLLELRAPLDSGHSVNVAAIARNIAFECRMSRDGMRKVYLAALLHDVGMILIEDLLIHKQGGLSEEEYRKIQEHSALAEKVLRPILDDGEVLRYIRHHHERYDGTGYPDGFKGNIIPLGARIIAVAEAFDAMSRCRPYRNALSAKRALAELHRCAGTQFDPQVVAVFSRIFEKIARDLLPQSADRS